MSVALNRTIAVAFGRFNPPTKGHAKVFRQLDREARARNCPAVVFATPTSGDTRNPLPFGEKVMYLRQLFPKLIFAENPNIRNPFEALVMLSNGGYTHVVIVTGDDRIKDYEYLRRMTNAKEHKKDYVFVQLAKVDIVPVKRDNVSATKLRDAAGANDASTFTKGLPTHNARLAKQIFNRVRLWQHVNSKNATGVSARTSAS